MTKFSIALTGSHGVGKTFIIDEIEKRATDLGILVHKIPSPTRYVKSLGFPNNKGLDYRLEVMCLALRIERQKLALQACEEDEKNLILADRCCLDELSYTREAIAREGESEAGVNRAAKLQQVYSLFYDFVVGDLLDYWDRVCYKPPHPDYMPVADIDRLGDRQYQLDIDREIRFHFKGVKTQEGSEFLVSLDIDRDYAVEEVWNLVREGLSVG